MGSVNLVGPLTHSVLYLRHTFTRLVLKLFRGEPAITEFDWPFTPCHNSSKPFSTDPGSDFHVMLLTLPPGHGKITQLRVYRMQLCRPIQTRFRYGSVPTTLNLAAYDNSPAHYAKGTPSADRSQPPTACKRMVSGTISLPFRGAFHLSLTVLVHYR